MSENPTNEIDVSIEKYIQTRTLQLQSHMINGIPDYAYGPDFFLREKIRKIPGVYKIFKALLSYYGPVHEKKLNLDCVKVGPSQYPEIYEMGKECARILGIGVPEIYINGDISEINAYTYATDDTYPVIVLYSEIVRRFTPQELMTVIGHECGHIHNNHSIYNTAAEILFKGALTMLPPAIRTIISIPFYMSLQMWSRAAEVTSDRAGIICSKNPEDILSADIKLLSAGDLGYGDINVDAVLKQYEAIKNSPVRFQELLYSHPIIVRRLFAEKEFMNSEILYKWRPEWKKEEMKLIDKQELDSRCEKYIAVRKRGK